MIKMKNFFKKYGFYIALAVVCIGAVTTVLLLPNDKGDVSKQPNPYAKNKEAAGSDIDNENFFKEDVAIEYEENNTPQEEADANQDKAKDEEVQAAKVDQEDQNARDKKEDVEVAAKSFDETTASKTEAPFMADNDILGFPVKGDIVVPYTDDNSKYWYSQALNQTMRTYGICIAAKEGTPVKAVTKGIITDIIDDASTMNDDYMTCFGKVIVLEAGNGYVFRYGIQGGDVNKELLGKVVEPGDVIATSGKGKGAYASVEDNVYLQLLHDGEVVDVTKFLSKEQ